MTLAEFAAPLISLSLLAVGAVFVLTPEWIGAIEARLNARWGGRELGAIRGAVVRPSRPPCPSRGINATWRPDRVTVPVRLYGDH